MILIPSWRTTRISGRYCCASFLLMTLLCIGMFSPICQAQSTSPDVGVRFKPPTAVLLTDATVIVSPGRKLEKADVLIRDGKIAKVGIGLATPADAEVVPCEGKYLYPGLIDAFVEFPTPPDASQAASWNPQVQPQRRIAQSLKADAGKLEALRKAGITVALAAPDNGLIKGQSCVITTATGSLETTLLRNAAFQHIRPLPERGFRGAYPSSPMGAVALIRQTLLDANWYQQAIQAYQSNPSIQPPDQNVSLAALEDVIRGRQSVIIDGPNDLYALRADRLAKEFSLKLVLRGSGREYRQLDAIASTRRPIIVPVDFPKAPEVGTRAAAAETTLQALMHWHLAPENPGRLEKAGVDFVLSTDSIESLGEFLPNITKAVSRGLTPDTALAALTTRPAKLLEIDHIAGTIESGKIANILVTDGPLFEKQTKLLETWVSGQRSAWVDEGDTSLEGTWQLTLARQSAPQNLDLKLTGSTRRLKGELALPGAFKSNADATPSAKADVSAAEKKPELDTNKAASAEVSPAPENKAAADKPAPDGQAKSELTKTDVKSSESASDAGKAAKEQADKLAKSKTELKQLKFDGYRLSGSFKADNLIASGPQGTGFIDGTIETADKVESFRGTIQWPDGSTERFQATLSKDTEDGKKSEDGGKGKGNKDQESKGEGFEVAVNFPLGAYGVAQPPVQPARVLMRGATIWTCGPQGIIQGGDVLIENGRIAAVDKRIDAPADVTIVDATGMYISPGIIDCHSHMATDGGVNEAAQAITAEVRIADFIDPTDITIYRQLAGGVTTANILHGSANPIGGQNQVIKLRWGLSDDQMLMTEAPGGIKFALGENVKRASSTETENARYPFSRMGVEQIMRDRFEAAKLYREKQRQWITNPSGLPPRRDLELDAIAEILEKKRWIHCHSYRQDEILTFLRLLEDYNVTVGSLQHILEGYKVADAMAKHGATGSSFSDWWAYKMEVWDAIPFNGALMHRAGVIVSFNSDDDELARHLNHEAAKAVKYGGVPPEEALKFVTLNPAKQLRIDRHVGSIEPGKHADLVIWNGPPLSTLSVCMQTWIDGRKYFDRQDDLKRRETDAQLHRTLVQKILSNGEKTTGRSQNDKDPSTWWVRYDEFCNHGHHHDEHVEHGEHHEEE